MDQTHAIPQHRRASLRTALSCLVAAFAIAIAGCNAAPDIPFAGYGDGYAEKPDFAQVEHDYPLTPVDLQKLTPKNIKRLDQEQLDQVYARLTAGPIPDGAYDGDLVFPKSRDGDRRISEIVGGFRGAVVEFKTVRVESLARALWKGKVFYRDQRLLRNRIEDTRLLSPLVGSDMDALPKTDFDGDDQWLLFPARLYCGQSLIDSRRESIIIDYAFSDTLPGYREKPDFLAGRNGLQVRDEIRMVRPGFYLGRAYIGRVFLLDFTLYNKDVAERDGPAFAQSGEAAEDCWTGTQERRLVAATEYGG
ncbi:MAG TPA: hypothetical protein PLF73_00260 [Luteimonas sp.]|mgnify:CR=1 FL=1|nr:hypothetical protein [Luteimonas sp.]HRO27625.1 hypothetical protein [Luteimonas sp.]